MSPDPRVEADVARASRLMRGLAEGCYEASDNERDNEENMRFETIGIVTIVAWEDSDGNTKEDVAYAFETKRHHVKTGILQDTLAAHLHRTTALDER